MRKVLYFVFAVLILAALSGCNKEIKPQDRFSQYVEHWNKQEFEKMYEFLSKDAKQSISKKDFAARYEKVYKDLEIDNLKVTYKPDMEKEYKKKKMRAFLFQQAWIVQPARLSLPMMPSL